VTLWHVGPFADLLASHAAPKVAQEQGIALDSWDTDRGSVWRACVEHYLGPLRIEVLAERRCAR
jgi:hypothetical protein